MTESSRVPRVLKSEMTESTWVPRLLKSEMTATSRVPFSSMYQVWNSNKSWMLSKSFVTFTLASRLMNPWCVVYTFLGSRSVFYSPNTIIYRSSIFFCIRRTCVSNIRQHYQFLFCSPPPKSHKRKRKQRCGEIGFPCQAFSMCS